MAGDPDRPIACNMIALSSDERRRYDVLRASVVGAVEHVDETPTGFCLRVGRSVPFADVAEWIEMEHRCCAFLDMTIALHSDGSVWIEIGGSAAIKRFLKEEFAAFK